jgi:hypothetical protein
VTSTRTRRLLSGVLALSLVAAACGGDDDATDTTAAPAPAAEEPAGEPAEEPAAEPVADGVLADICPSPLVIQTDWHAESEHGALYNLIGEGYTVEKGRSATVGPMVLDGVDLGIDFEIREGGPAIGFSSPSSIIYSDDSVHLAYANTDAQILTFQDTPVLSVVAPLEKNPQMIMWDPETYPDVEDLSDLGDLGVTINIFAGQTYADVFVALGVLSEDQIDPSYDATPARFIAEQGKIAQQGFASSEPYSYKNTFEEWGKDVAFTLLNDNGFPIYSQTIAIKPSDKEEMDACLTELVPIFQQSVVSYHGDPAGANAVILDVNEQLDDGWVYTAGNAEYAAGAMAEFGLVGNGPDAIVGNMDTDRIQEMIDNIALAGLEFEEGLAPADIVTNEYIDTSIGFPVEQAEQVSLADICPSPLVIQTDWHAESEHGALYNLIGEGYTVEKGRSATVGPMVLDGVDLGIDFEIREGGPAIGFSSPSSIIYSDDSVHLAYANTDAQILTFQDTPVLSVVAPLEKNPQMIMWDPETYPDVEDLSDLGDLGVTINIFAGQTYADVFVALGVLSEDQIDPSYDATPARFIAEQGKIAQQGFASSEPYSYKNTFEEWGKDVAFTLLNDNGFPIYSQTIAIKPSDKEEMDACLTELVPIFQQSVVSYHGDPAGANAVILDVNEQLDDGWVYTAGNAEYAAGAMAEFGLVGNGPDAIVGNMDTDRIQEMIDNIALAGLEFEEGLAPADIVTNEYIDTSIGF